jgi:hypothetical protein
MALLESVRELLRTLEMKHVEELQKEILEKISNHIESCKMILEEHSRNLSHLKKKKRQCLKCKTTDPGKFHRKKSECTPCMSKAGYEKIKIRLNIGKERNVQARLERKECSVCKLQVERQNAQMFDWDHRNPSEKRFAISKMNYKEDAIFFEEIAKCDLTCRNCHMMRTMRQFQENTIPKRQSNLKSVQA